MNQHKDEMLKDLDEPLPQIFVNNIAEALNPGNFVRGQVEYYPYLFHDVRLIIQASGHVDRLRKWIAYESEKIHFKSFLSIYKVDQYELADNTLGLVGTDGYNEAVRKASVSDKLSKEGEMPRNII